MAIWTDFLNNPDIELTIIAMEAARVRFLARQLPIIK
jgi:hypothetical protein